MTTGLLNAIGYLKDDRLLPRGFDKRTASAQIAVHGAALDDPQFIGGQDRAAEPRRFNGYFDAMASTSAVTLASAQARVP